MHDRNPLLRRSLLAAAVSGASTAGAGTPLAIEVHPESAGIVQITGVSGFGSFADPLVVEIDWNGGELDATITINGALDQLQRGENPADGPNDWGIFVEARVTNQSGTSWRSFDNELQQEFGVPSGNDDLLSFAQSWDAVRPGGGMPWFGSPQLPVITEENQARDFVNFSGGSVEHRGLLIMRYVITDDTPENQFHLRQRANFGDATIDVTWEAPCLTPGDGSASFCICNASSADAIFDWTISAIPATPGTPCNVDGPEDITPDSGQVLVPAGQCVEVEFTFTCQEGLNSGDHGCLHIVAAPGGTGAPLSRVGSTLVVDHWLAVPSQLVYGIPFGSGTDVCFEITNIMEGEIDGVLDFQFVAVTSDMDAPFQDIISLDGLPPGTAVPGSVTLSHGESQTVCVSVSYEEDDPYTFYAILLEYDVDENPRTPIEAAASAAIVSIPPVPCPADINGDGVVDEEDLLALVEVLLGTDDCGLGCPVDVNGDGVINVDDLTLLVESWGPC